MSTEIAKHRDEFLYIVDKMREEQANIPHREPERVLIGQLLDYLVVCARGESENANRFVDRVLADVDKLAAENPEFTSTLEQMRSPGHLGVVLQGQMLRIAMTVGSSFACNVAMKSHVNSLDNVFSHLEVITDTEQEAVIKSVQKAIAAKMLEMFRHTFTNPGGDTQ